SPLSSLNQSSMALRETGAVLALVSQCSNGAFDATLRRKAPDHCIAGVNEVFFDIEVTNSRTDRLNFRYKFRKILQIHSHRLISFRVSNRFPLSPVGAHGAGRLFFPGGKLFRAAVLGTASYRSMASANSPDVVHDIG